MRVEFNTSNNHYRQTSPSFERLLIRENAEDVILARIAPKAKQKAISYLSQLMANFDSKQVTLELLADKTGKRLQAAIYDGKSYYEKFEEGRISAILRGPLHFIKKMAKQANEVEEFNIHKKAIDEALKSFRERYPNY